MPKVFVAVLCILFSVFAHAGPVNINVADASALAAELNGIGMARAEAIVAYREQYGAFTSAEELLNVNGIGEHILNNNRGNILIGEQ